MDSIKEQYINDLKIFLNASSNSKLMLAILEEVDENNEISLLKPIKEKISKKTGINVSSINSRISTLMTNGLIMRKSTTDSREAVYMLNPDVFGKKNWDKIKKININIEYDLLKNKKIKI
ncbi:hypothetical protein CFVI97532_07045 [Campylobacter fetus subsp. venerealis cfvi97/532]|nr:hypothetical protein CFVI97532_07045 [Campylobacter fetus subsp. venerealis cfvi97/532]